MNTAGKLWLLILFSVVGMLAHLAGAAEPRESVLRYEVVAPADPEKKPDVKALVAAIDKRLNPAEGASLGKVVLADESHVEVRIPSVDPKTVDKVEQIVGANGTLAFRIIANPTDHAALIAKAKANGNDILYADPAASSKDREAIAAWLRISPAIRNGYHGGVLRRDQQGNERILVVMDSFAVNESHLTQISADEDAAGRPCVDLVFNDDGAKRFGQLSSANLPDAASGRHRNLAVIFDGTVLNTPMIAGTITRQAQISGAFTPAQIAAMVSSLSTGPLPCQIRKVGN